jgi:hypothetical protein
MQIFSFCMAYFSTQFYPAFSMGYGAPEEIRTPDPQIRSLLLSHELKSQPTMANRFDYFCRRGRGVFQRLRRVLVAERREGDTQPNSSTT